MAMSERDPEMSDRDAMEALLPFYLNGTLDGEDLAAVEAWLANDPSAIVALEEAQAEFSATTETNEALRPPADALGRFSKMLEQEAGSTRSQPAASPLSGFWNRIAGIPPKFAWATAALTIALVVLQTAIDYGDRGNDYEVAGSEQDLAAAPFVLVVFRADARMVDIAALLDANGAAIAGGPTAGGVFRIAIPAKTVADYDRVFGVIQAAPFVESAVAGKKPADGG